jgi:hypothetical protein
VRADSAESWLREHDHEYGDRSLGWKQIRHDGTYRRPRREIPWGLADDLERLVEAGNQRRGPKVRGYVGEVGRRISGPGTSRLTET